MTTIPPLTNQNVKFLDNYVPAHNSLGLSALLTNIIDLANANRLTGRNEGSVATARLAMPNQPAHQDTIDIGADVYEFLLAGSGTVTALDANIVVPIGAAAADTRDNLLAAINATVLTAGVFTKPSGGAAAIIGTEPIVADELTTDVRIRSAFAPGGSVVGASPDILLAEAITDAADIWDVGNVNLNTLAGVAGGEFQTGVTSLTITAAMLTAGDVRFDFEFTVVDFTVTVKSSTGAGKITGVDTVAIDNGGLLLTLGGVAIVATDVVTVMAWSAPV